MIIDHSGQNGHNGQSGTKGKNQGSTGKCGHDGQNGSHGQAISIFMVANQNGYNIFDNIGNQNRNDIQFQNNLVLISNGGKGGNGGDGGNGQNGYDGSNGSDATSSSNGTNGGDGGNGGNGGNGGKGGHGGSGGLIQIFVNCCDLDLLMVTEYANKGGLGGKGGIGGQKGYGGIGGRGGSSYSWTTTSTRQDGDETITETHHHSNSGGMSGSNGADGNQGINGIDGYEGSDGQFLINVVDLNIISKSRYDLSVNFFPLPNSIDNIYEPGEKLCIDYIEFQNTGGLMTPIYQPIYVNIISEGYINSNEELFNQINDSIQSGQNYNLIKQFQFSLNGHTNQIPLNKPLRSNANIKFRALLGRVNRFFQNVPQYSRDIKIRNPVEFSRLIMQNSISIDEEAPITIGIKNVSSLGLGKEQGRLLKAVLLLEDGCNELLYLDKNNLQHVIKRNQLFQFHELEIKQIQSYSTLNLSGTFQFTNSQLPFNSTAQLRFQLYLGKLDDPMNQYQIIQEMQTKLQLTEKYIYRKDSEFLLVINSETSSDIIIDIKRFAEDLGTSCDVWNVTNYNGFSYNQPLNCDQKFNQLLINKVVVIINIDYLNEMGEKINILDQMGYQSIFEAAQKYSIATYIINEKKLNPNQIKLMGSNFLIDQEIIKVNDDEIFINVQKQRLEKQQLLIQNNLMEMIAQEQIQIFIEKIYHKLICCQDINEQLLIEKLSKIENFLKNSFPTKQFNLIYNFEPTFLQSNCCSDTYSLGSVTIRKSLPKNKTLIGVAVLSNINKIFEWDKYAMIKLMPMEKKLRYLNITQNNNLIQLTAKAIISDLLQESLCFVKNQSINIPEINLQTHNWNQLDQIQNQIEESISIIMLKEFVTLHATLLQQLSFTDKYICCCSREKKIINYFCTRLRNRVLRSFFINNIQYQNLINSEMRADLSIENVLKPEIFMNKQVYLFHSSSINQISIQEDIQLPLPIQNIQEEKFKFFYDDFEYNYLGYDNDKRNQVITEFESKISYFDD